MGTFDSTSTWYIFSMPLFTCAPAAYLLTLQPVILGDLAGSCPGVHILSVNQPCNSSQKLARQLSLVHTIRRQYPKQGRTDAEHDN